MQNTEKLQVESLNKYGLKKALTIQRPLNHMRNVL